nr:MAG TPA: hypothetical protein [Caudoviricetes sp.]
MAHTSEVNQILSDKPLLFRGETHGSILISAKGVRNAIE